MERCASKCKERLVVPVVCQDREKKQMDASTRRPTKSDSEINPEFIPGDKSSRGKAAGVNLWSWVNLNRPIQRVSAD